ncbi:MAG: hypothetical protein JWQ25_1336 [Daejeonella sp.]|nr:hypothetical protein [Daejeonella sp.]
MKSNILILLIISVSFLRCYGQTKSKDDYLVSFADTIHDSYGYKSQKGKIVIPAGKYTICFTDTFKAYAIVSKPGVGLIAINRQEKILYQVFPFDNGPDYPSNGLFRILKNHKIGFADAATGRIRIQPQFDCAFPFENGIAKVSINCQNKSDGEHTVWLSEHWYYINRTGKKVKKQEQLRKNKIQ